MFHQPAVIFVTSGRSSDLSRRRAEPTTVRPLHSLGSLAIFLISALLLLLRRRLRAPRPAGCRRRRQEGRLRPHMVRQSLPPGDAHQLSGDVLIDER